MISNPYATYQENSIKTASGPELTLMLYNGAIKFCNMAVEEIKNKNVPKAHEHIMKVQTIIEELRSTLNKKYPIALEMDQIYEFVYELLVKANIQKDAKKVEDASTIIREYRDAWQIAMKSRN